MQTHQGFQSSVFPTQTSLFLQSTPTLVHQNILQPRITPGPTSCSPNTLVVNIATTVVISDFSGFYGPASIETFVPSYATYPDGSLLSPPFRKDITDASVSLLVMGALTMIFARNIFVSGDYIRRGKVKNKMLFYALFVSQMLAPVSLAPVITSYFSQKISCQAVVILSCLCGATSLALLITVILGIKVYKCMNNARFIPVFLGLFQLASAAVVVLDIVQTRGVHRLTGSCIRADDLRFTRYFVIIQFAESLFICCCFLYVCWRSRGSPAARGRISIQLSMDDLPIEFPADTTDNKVTTARRGWWDYVPDKQVAAGSGNGNAVLTEKNSAQNAKTPGKPLTNGLRNLASQVQTMGAPIARNSLAPSSTSRLSRLVPRMELFRKVMKDELLYTTFITFNCVIVAVLVIIGVNVKNGLTVTGWIALNWCIISLLAIHSFGRVVHRHERDALLSHPVTCTAIARAANEIADRDDILMRRQRAISSLPPMRRSLRISEESVSKDPFADTEPLAPTRSRGSEISYEGHKFSIVPVPRSQTISGDSLPNMLLGRDVFNTLPMSPDGHDIPTSNPGTPTVFNDSLGNPKRQEFAQSWLISSSSHSLYSESLDDRRSSNPRVDPKGR